MNPTEALSIAFTITAAGAGFIVALYSLHLAICTRIECRAMKESTHQVQFVPLEPKLDDDSADAANTIAERKDYDDLAEIHEREEPLN